MSHRISAENRLVLRSPDIPESSEDARPLKPNDLRYGNLPTRQGQQRSNAELVSRFEDETSLRKLESQIHDLPVGRPPRGPLTHDIVPNSDVDAVRPTPPDNSTSLGNTTESILMTTGLRDAFAGVLTTRELQSLRIYIRATNGPFLPDTVFHGTVAVEFQRNGRIVFLDHRMNWIRQPRAPGSSMPRLTPRDDQHLRSPMPVDAGVSDADPNSPMPVLMEDEGTQIEGIPANVLRHGLLRLAARIRHLN